MSEACGSAEGGDPDVRGYFQRVASEWDHLRQGYFPDEVRDAVVWEAYPEAWMRAADIGGGTGFISEELAPRVAWVHCIDASSAMLGEARRRLGQIGNVSYHLAEGETLPLGDASIEIAVANMVLHHMPDPARALREWARVLCPGGRLVVADMDAHDEAWMRDDMADLWPGFQRADVAAWFRDAGLMGARVASSGET